MLNFKILKMLYSKSDEMPVHWPRRTLGPIVHVSPHPREFNQHHFRRAPRRARTTGLPQQARASRARMSELSRAHLELSLSSPTTSSSLVSSLELACSKLAQSSMMVSSSPRVSPCVGSSAADSPCLVLPRILSIVLVTPTVARQHHLSAGPLP